MRRVFAAMCLAALALLTMALPASAAFVDQSWEVLYAGTQHSVIPPIEGVGGSQSDRDSTQSVSCTVEACEVALTADLVVTLSPGETTATTSTPAEGDACTGTGARTFRVTVAGSTLTTEYAETPLGPDTCDGSTNVRTSGATSTFTGDWVSGDLCTLHGEHCTTEVESTATPSEEVAAAPIDTTPASLRDSAAAPSVLSSLATPAAAGTSLPQLALTALLTVILVLLVAFPTSLLNSATEAGSDRISQWWSARRDPSRARPAQRTWARSWWWAAAGVAAASVISAFVDPGFGLNAASVRVVLSLLAGFALEVVVGWTLVVLLMRRIIPGVKHSYAFQPLSLLVVVAAVVFTRATGFEPGIVFGLVAGVAFAAVVGKAAQARAVLIALGYAFALALVAWVLYGVFSGASGESFWTTFLVEMLSSIAIGGMVALPIALVPLRGLPGHAVWAWSRLLWGVCYAVGLFAFFVALMPMPFSWDAVGWDLWAWIGVYLLYAAAAVVAWVFAARPWRGEDEASSGETAAEAASVPADRLEE